MVIQALYSLLALHAPLYPTDLSQTHSPRSPNHSTHWWIGTQDLGGRALGVCIDAGHTTGWPGPVAE